MLNLKPEYLELVKKILAMHASGATVWAYGSRVTGTAHDGSDLDLVLIGAKENATIAILRTAFTESTLPILVDIVDWADIPDTFKDEIKKRYEVVQE